MYEIADRPAQPRVDSEPTGGEDALEPVGDVVGVSDDLARWREVAVIDGRGQRRRIWSR
jgi:hypothetical protein